MAKREVLGVMDCPECGLSGAEVKRAKSGLLYRWCPECNAQYFPRTVEGSARLGLRAGMAGAVPEKPAEKPAEKIAASPVTVTETIKPARVEKSSGFSMGL
jgi:hypothetical protein